MPQDNPASIGDEDYLDIMTYVLQGNAYPAGAEALTAEALDGIQIMRKPGT